MIIYDNSSGPRTIREAFSRLSQKTTSLCVASPFFSYSDPILESLVRGSEVRLIIRLGPATSATELSKLALKTNIQIRYFTSERFHSKIYIFGSGDALIGSANMTQSGFMRNCEATIHVHDRETVSQAEALFDLYWADALPIDVRGIEKYKALTKKQELKESSPLESIVEQEFGTIEPRSFMLSQSSLSPREAYFSEYSRQFQEFLAAFTELKTIFIDSKVAHHPAETLPLRLSVDNFLNYVRDHHAQKDSYAEAPLLSKSERRDLILPLIRSWDSCKDDFYLHYIPDSYRIMTSFFHSPDSIGSASVDTIATMLERCHAFRGRLRFFEGGFESLLKSFFEKNSVNAINRSFEYLIFGSTPYIQRMCDCIYDPQYQLHEFKRSCVQELHGWANREDIPICNRRTVKSLRYLGFNVREYW